MPFISTGRRSYRASGSALLGYDWSRSAPRFCSLAAAGCTARHPPVNHRSASLSHGVTTVSDWDGLGLSAARYHGSYRLVFGPHQCGSL
ncbi:MAG: hypothetical protein GF363_04095 [Chitinivibrionales bacterium]|nr:hypothetical protein [Chitinivibrionales bacterium]